MSIESDFVKYSWYSVYFQINYAYLNSEILQIFFCSRMSHFGKKVLSPTGELPSEIHMKRCTRILLVSNSEILSVHPKILRDKRGHAFHSQYGIGMLPYIPLL